MTITYETDNGFSEDFSGETITVSETADSIEVTLSTELAELVEAAPCDRHCGLCRAKNFDLLWEVVAARDVPDWTPCRQGRL